MFKVSSHHAFGIKSELLSRALRVPLTYPPLATALSPFLWQQDTPELKPYPNPLTFWIISLNANLQHFIN